MAKILVVEDEAELREAFVGELTDEGHITIEAGNGQEGLEQLAREKPDMIISDITMPVMNGYQFFRSVKENHPEHATTPFIFMTALSDRDDELKGLRLGVDDYLSKPVDFDLLLARVELALRRRQVQAAPVAQPETPANPGAVEGQPAAGQNLEAIMKGSAGLIQTGKFQTITLDSVREKIGDRSEEIWDEILELAEKVIREQMGPSDVFYRTPSHEFLVCFADIDGEQADAKIAQIRDLIWERLFAHTDDLDLSATRAQSFELQLDANGNEDDEIIVSEIEGLIHQDENLASEASKRTLLQLFQYEDLYALPLLTAEGVPSKVKVLSFQKKENDHVRKLFNSGRYEGPFLLELQTILFERLMTKQSFREAFSRAAMLLSIRFQMISDDATREGLVQLCKELKESLGMVLIIEMTDTPDRIKSQVNSLKPLPIGRQLHFLEIRRVAQMDDLDLGELGTMGIAFVSMAFEQVMQEKAAGLRQLIAGLLAKGVKFLIKDIPAGKLFEAQSYGANLYAMRK